MPVSADNLPGLLAEMEREHFFGTISFQFRAGKVVLIRREETLLPSGVAKTNIDGGPDHERKRYK